MLSLSPSNERSQSGGLQPTPPVQNLEIRHGVTGAGPKTRPGTPDTEKILSHPPAPASQPHTIQFDDWLAEIGRVAGTHRFHQALIDCRSRMKDENIQP
jgi:hypothetical protein